MMSGYVAACLRRSLRAAVGGLMVGAWLASPAYAQGKGDPVRGKQIFARCSVCHAVEDSPVKKMGPSLSGVVGRRAASVAGFKYSAAMGASKLTWTPQNLDKFLLNPRALVPGTMMMAAPVVNSTDRTDLIAYLASAGRKPK